ncbi:EAL domain-containing protein [Thioflavicoccus mobilis 8321]|uniref:EAL domain-containing protein n=1 Tax=Thioflavicoccus mobilis 8321 TaxID=765912 RepID=L0H316_9GAMM|nr:EAL domain-containing protein [Thioflavicoccus mobilis]AGA92040.1 EAL domain-containing protein [Thioflavicoccus mobilis 8321]
MDKVKQILCIDPEPPELRLETLLNQRGIAASLTEAARPEQLREALSRPDWWDLILCDATSYLEQGVEELVTGVRDALAASVVLLRQPGGELTPAAGYHRGADDVVEHGDMDHLTMVCERELRNATTRKALRAAAGRREAPASLTLATISDLSSTRHRTAARAGAGTSAHAAAGAGESEEARIKALIDAGGLSLEFQPIITFRTRQKPRPMFEALARLKDETGRVLLPGEFLPIVERAGWMDKVDLWLFRQVLTTLEEMREDGHRDAILFVNVATQLLRSKQSVEALGTFATAAHTSPGSLVVEFQKSAFEEEAALAGLRDLSKRLRTRQHGLLVENIRTEDRAFLSRHRDLITHVKLDRALAQDLAEGRLAQPALAELIRGAKRDGFCVIALAVESATLLSTLFSAGVDAIQGHFVSLPHAELVYPTVQEIEASTPAWRVPGEEG